MVFFLSVFLFHFLFFSFFNTTKPEMFLVVKNIPYHFIESFETSIGWLWSKNMLLHEYVEFSNQVYIFL
jgi:hypothetical protein